MHGTEKQEPSSGSLCIREHRHASAVLIKDDLLRDNPPDPESDEIMHKKSRPDGRLSVSREGCAKTWD